MSSDTPTPAPVKLSRRSLQVGAAAIVLLGAAIVIGGTVTRTSQAALLRERADTQAVRSVALIAPASAATAATLELPGRLEAYSRAPIYARVSGYLKSWKADIGTPVKAGQLLAEIETPDLDQQLLQARANLASAQANAALSASTAKRWQALLASDSVSRQEADEKSGDLATKQAMLKAAQADVDRVIATKGFTRIVAPFDGVVTARSTDVGALINAGGGGPELFVISDTKTLRVYVNVPQNFVAVVKRGAKARISVPEHPGKTYTATIASSSGAVNTASGSMLIQLSVDNADAELLPGGFANVSLDLPKEVAASFTVPPSALIFSKSGLQVATLGLDNKVLLKTVTIARDYGKVVELASGVGAGERIIDNPADDIANGDLVKVAAADAAAAAPAAKGAKRE
jgi:RND family efflux transporter MFP subunit